MINDEKTLEIEIPTKSNILKINFAPPPAVKAERPPVAPATTTESLASVAVLREQSRITWNWIWRISALLLLLALSFLVI